MGAPSVDSALPPVRVPCNPPQFAHTCHCPNTTETERMTLPRCVKTHLCGKQHRKNHSHDNDARAAYVIVLDYNETRVRYYYRFDPFESYATSMRLIMRLVLSLRDVRTSLPIHLLASGTRYKAYEQRLREYGVHIQASEYNISIPKRIINPWHIGSFAKLHVLSMVQFSKIILLDQDLVVLRPIDHLSTIPTPAAVFKYKCFPNLELNSGLMVLRPNVSEWVRLQRMLRNNSAISVIRNDRSDQLVWRHFFRRVHILPVGYNEFRSGNLTEPVGWDHSHVVHDIWKYNHLKLSSGGGSVERRLLALNHRAAAALHDLPTVTNDHPRHHGLPFRRE